MNETSITSTQLKEYFGSRGFSPLVFNISEEGGKHIVQDIALIQSFYGNDPERIAATSNALRAMVKSTAFPEEWIFIEGQKSKSDCAFSWLKKYGIKHVFVKTTSKQDGIFLKTPLWNIGAKNSKSSKLCFVDSDMAFCNSGWLEDVAQKLDSGFGVVSPHGFSYYENLNEEAQIDESIGHSLENGSKVTHYGFAIAMSKKTFAQLGRFKASYILDDLDYWTSIVGTQPLQHVVDEWKIDGAKQYGIDVEVGSTEQIVCHCDHGEREDRKYRQLVDICLNRCNRLDDIIVYDPSIPENLPIWNLETPIGRIACKAVNACKNSDDKDKSGNDWYFEEAEKEFGTTDESSPLIVVTCLSKSGYRRNLKSISAFKEKLESQIENVAGFVCFSNIKLEEGCDIDIVPIEDNNDAEFMQVLRKDVKFPDNSNILYIPFGIDVDISRICQCENSILGMSDNGIAYFKYSKDFVQKLRKGKASFQTQKIEKYLKLA